MRVVQLIPGTANTFYCQNCMRDAGAVRTMRRAGHDVTMVPLYLPMLGSGRELVRDTPIFFGGINVYLQQKWSLFRRTPRIVDRLFDARGLLRFVAHHSGLTDARELAATMLSMLRGDEGHQSKEYHRLIDWLVERDRPDVVVLSNVLLCGFVPSLRKRLDATIVCLLEDEDEFLDELPDGARQEAERIIVDHCKGIDGFVTCSRYYADVARRRFGVPDERLTVIHNGIDIEQYAIAPQAPDPPVIGYLSRMHPDKGLDVLAEAFVKLKGDPAMRSVKLRIAGGQTPDDQPFVDRVRRMLEGANVMADVETLPNLEPDERVRFVQSLSVLSVPTRRPEAFGMFMLEALACGVPVVQPDHGAYGEVLGESGGGRLFPPGDVAALAAGLRDVIEHHAAARQQAIAARSVIAERFNAAGMAGGMMKAYERAATGRRSQGA